MAEDQEFTLPPLEERPLVTFALFAYNQEKYIRKAVEGAFAQTYEPLEIILSDDGSGDATFAIMQELVSDYIGPHHVRINRNPENIGLASHVNRVLAMAQGEIIALAGGDDISLPNRVSETVTTFACEPLAMAVSFSDRRIDETGAMIGEGASLEPHRSIHLEAVLAAGPRAQANLCLSGASRALRREVYDAFGDLLPESPAEDMPFLLRALYLGKLVVSEQPGILYRVHPSQMSSPSGIARHTSAEYEKQLIRDLNVAIYKNLLTHEQEKSILKFIKNFNIEQEIRKISYTKSIPNACLTLDVFMSNFFSIREKFGLLKRFILRKQM